MHTRSHMYTWCCVFFRIMDSLSAQHFFFVEALELMSRASIKERETTRPAPSIKRSLIGIASFFPSRNIRPNLSSRIIRSVFILFFIFQFCFIVLQEKKRRLKSEKKMRLLVCDVSVPCADKSASNLNR